MLTKQSIPSQLQVMYNCDYLLWDNKEGVYYRVICDPFTGQIIDYLNPITRDELYSIWADLEEALIREEELWLAIYDDIWWQKKNN